MRWSPIWLVLCGLLIGAPLMAQELSNHGVKFEQLGTVLPTPNQYRAADGAPGDAYWQQRCDYVIKCTLDPEALRLTGSEQLTYYNESPQTLKYLWLQLDENEHSHMVDSRRDDPSGIRPTMSANALDYLEISEELKKYGHKIQQVTDAQGKKLEYLINQTMMKVMLPEPLEPGQQFVFNVDWYYNITNRRGGPAAGGRGGYEYFEDTEDYIFTITQWFPRMAVYDDVEGWQNKQFTGRGEFALEFGDYEVEMTLPDDYMVGATGECQNYEEVLNKEEFERWQQAQTAAEPVEIRTLSEALDLEGKKPSKKTTTWKYQAKNVRDFAWTASRKFVWDAMLTEIEDGGIDGSGKIMSMSYYPKESYPIYSRYSTKVVDHTLKTYSKYTFPYPYPVAISVEASNGMEYPMICFNYGRAEEDGTYTERAKNGAIGVIIHEVGHNFFPMIVNSDERQWTWMDEGLNTFLQFVTEREFDIDWKARRGPANGIVDYMALPKNQLEPIMTNSENIVLFGPNAYGKPATALNILRETIMGRELFDQAFQEYSRRWMFKHPRPADFFRTMEDASGVDLDWFWRGWFYSIDAVDISMDKVTHFVADLENDPEPFEYVISNEVPEKPFEDLNQIRNREEGFTPAVERDSSLRDFYTTYRPWETQDTQKVARIQYAESLTDEEKQERYSGKHYYQIQFSNQGGLVAPVILEFEFEDGTTKMETVPVEIWRKNENSFSKVFVTEKPVAAIQMDPLRQTADIDESNNVLTDIPEAIPFQVYKSHKAVDTLNPMQKAMGKDKVIKP